MKLRDLLETVDNTYLYHATYKQLLPSIKKKGLDPNISKKSWDFSRNYVYLSPDRDVAESYAETSDSVPEEYIDSIVILRVKRNLLDKNKLSVDKNNKSEDTLQYSGVIPWRILEIA